MRKLKKALSLVLAIALVLGLCTIGAAADFNAEIYNNSDEGISISLSRSTSAVAGKDLSVTVVVDGETRIEDKLIEDVPRGGVNVNITAEGYDVTYICENVTVGANVLTLDTGNCALTIDLASFKTSDTVPLGNFGNFRWAKSNAGNSAFQRTLSVYVNDEFKQDFSVNTPKNLSNAGATDQFWFEPNTEFYSSSYTLDPSLTLDMVAYKDLSIYLKTKCACGQPGCQCEGRCTCEEGCDCEYCQPVLGENQIDTGYGIIEYKQPTASGYNLTVKVYVNGQEKFTSDKLRVKSGENGCLDFTPANGYYYFATNGYDLSTKYAGSSWVQGTGYLSIIGALNDSRDYDNVLQIYIWTFQQSALLDVTRMTSVEEKVTGYTISYEAYNPKTAQNETFTYEATSFLNAQAQRIPKDTDVTLTAQCVDGFEVSEWLTHESAGNGVTLTGSDGEREWGAGSTLAYGNSATLNVGSSFSSNVQVFINGIKQSTSGPDDPEAVSYIVNYYYDGVLDTDKTVTDTGTVGDTITITTVPDKSGTGYCLDRSNLPFELTAYEEQNVITVYYATDANDDDIPDSKQVFIKYVSSDTQLGTVSPDMQVETFANGVPSGIVLSSTAAAKSGAEFVNWTGENDFPVSDKETIDYTLKSPELGKTYTFTANFKAIPVETATLTYDDNGGNDDAPAPVTVEKNTTIPLSKDRPTHADVDGVEVAFGGWSLDDAVVGQIYDKDGEPGGIYTLSTITMNQNYTLYAVWGLDTNGNGTADFKEPQYTVTYKDGADGKVFGDQVYSGLLSGKDTPNYEGTLTHPDGLSFTGWTPTWSATVTGNVTYTATWTTPASPEKPASPTENELTALFDGKVNVQCVNSEAAHAAKSYGYEKAGFTVGEVMDAGTSYTVKVTIDAAYYQAKYNTDIAAKHNLASGQSTKVTVELRYDNGWKLNEAAPTIKVVCDTPAAPNAPAEDELKALFDGKVFVDCVAKSWHPTYGYGLLANGYTVTEPVKGADGEYTCTVTLLASAYLAEYNDDVAEKHALASYQGDEAVALKWTGSAWTVINGELPVTFDVVCDTWYPPIIPPVTPSEPVYTPNWLNTTDHVSYIIGYEDGTVKPGAGITRAEVATIFFRLLTDGARERFWSEANAYSDVAAGSWYNIAVSTLSNMGILGGYEDGTFRPNASITRAEFAKIAVSFFDWADIEAVNSFVDVRDSAWYANYVAVAAEIGLIEGYGGNVFRPDATITRAEACTIINRTLGRNPDVDHLLPVGQMNTWPDNSDTGVWYYAQIQEATNSHDYRWLGDIEQWTAKLTDPDWDKLQY